MKLNHLVLGAAGVLAATSAQAADLPVAPAPEPIDYVRICDAYGSGFFFIPGTETCLKIDGYVRFNVTVGEGESGTEYGRSYGRQSNSPLDAYVRGRLNFDAREETAWGTLRGFIRFEVERDIDSNADGQQSGPSDDFSTSNTFIQIGEGFLAGYNTSNYDFWTGFTTGGTVVGSDNTILQIAYTASFGNGLFATLALEDTMDRGQGHSTVDGNATNAAAQTASSSGFRYPDIVGNIAYEQGIFAAQVMGAIHWVEAANDLNAGTPSPKDDEVGFAVGGGVSVDLPVLAGVTAVVQGGYSYGAFGYTDVGSGWAGGDAQLNLVTGNVDLTQAWSVAGGLSAAVTDTITLNGQIGYTNADVGTINHDEIRGGGSIAWTPLDNLTLAASVDYQNFHTKNLGNAGRQESIFGTLRMQRNF